MVHLVWIGGTGVLQSILSSLYHAFAFKPITIKFGEFTNFWMLFQMTCPIFNSTDTEYSYQEKICSYPVPCSFRTWPIAVTTVFMRTLYRKTFNFLDFYICTTFILGIFSRKEIKINFFVTVFRSSSRYVKMCIICLI